MLKVSDAYEVEFDEVMDRLTPHTRNKVLQEMGGKDEGVSDKTSPKTAAHPPRHVKDLIALPKAFAFGVAGLFVAICLFVASAGMLLPVALLIAFLASGKLGMAIIRLIEGG